MQSYRVTTGSVGRAPEIDWKHAYNVRTSPVFREYISGAHAKSNRRRTSPSVTSCIGARHEQT